MASRREMERELKDLTAKIDELKTTVAQSQRALSVAENRQKVLVHELAPRQKNGVNVSDHALIRYLERRFKLDLDGLRAEILTPERISAIKAGAGRISVDGLKFIVKDNTIVTVVD